MEEMLRRIRAEAEERDLTWLVRLIDGPAGEAAPAPAAAPMFPMPEESGRRPRRARVPVRLSPEQAPARRRRVRSPSPAPPRDVPPATPTGRGRRPGGAAARRNIRAAPDVREQERANVQQTAAASERRQGAGGGAPGHVPVGAPARRSNRPDNGGSRQRPIRQQQAEDGGSRQRPSITEAAKRVSAPRKAAGTRTERFQPGGELPAARIDDPEDDESQQQDVGAAAGGYTAPSQPVGAVPDAGAGSGADGEAVPSTALERGKRAVGDLISQSLARGTRAAYSAAWTEWEDWMDQCGGAYSTDDRVGMLLSWLGRGSREGWTLGRVNRFMAGVAFGCKLKGVVDVTKNFIVRQALKGFRRGKGRPDTRRPVSFGILERLGGAIDLKPQKKMPDGGDMADDRSWPSKNKEKNLQKLRLRADLYPNTDQEHAESSRMEQNRQLDRDTGKISCVINLSSHNPTEVELSVLSRGLSFCPTKMFVKTELCSDMEEYFRRLRLKEFFHNTEDTGLLSTQTEEKLGAKKKSDWSPPPGRSPTLDKYIDSFRHKVQSTILDKQKKEAFNINMQEKRSNYALKSKEITIKPSDKDGAIVLMNISDYTTEADR
ncbi:uncharacterized protein [Eleutherodactylus coqui]|uniref:uncharacterized protein n=1 Tax=Eleutherodactylus coqui TaxID=57060 RepID=UPI0034632BBB